MIDINIELSIEQQFELRKIEDQAQTLTKEEAIALLIQMTRLAMMRDSVIKSLIKESCGSGLT